MKYLINKVVEAVKIEAIEIKADQSWITPENGEPFEVSNYQLYSSSAKPGDYWVTHSAGFTEAVDGEEFLEVVNPEPLRELIVEFLEKWDPEEFGSESSGRANYLAMGLIAYLRENQHVDPQLPEESRVNPDPQN